MILMDRALVPDVPLEVYFFRFHTVFSQSFERIKFLLMQEYKLFHYFCTKEL